MKIEPKEISVEELVQGYHDDGEGGVVGYGGKLDIRPPYQREFVYNSDKRNAVIDTITKNFPINVMYWAVRGDGTYEVIDGQQRTISIAQFEEGAFSFNGRYFNNLQDDEQQAIYDYNLMVYLCSGTDSERLNWFRTINIAGEQLTNQELRNAVYAGSWVSDAKRYFSRTNGAAYQIGQNYLKGKPIRQDYLETAIRWISEDNIEDYMGRHQHDEDAKPLWDYFQQVINWTKSVFVKKRTEMSRVDWGSHYSTHKDRNLDPAEIEHETAKLMADYDVTNKPGIYSYILDRDEKYLNIRKFTEPIRRSAYERQAGICPTCGDKFDISEMHGDHIDPWSKGGKTDADNCQMLCAPCNRRKSSK